jgi:hypothetical protein
MQHRLDLSNVGTLEAKVSVENYHPEWYQGRDGW